MNKNNTASKLKEFLLKELTDFYYFFSYFLKVIYGYKIIIFIWVSLYITILNTLNKDVINWINGITVSIISALLYETHKNYKLNLAMQPVLNMFYSHFYNSVETFWMDFEIRKLGPYMTIENSIGTHANIIYKTKDVFFDKSIPLYKKINETNKMFHTLRDFLCSSEKIKQGIENNNLNIEYEAALELYENFMQTYYERVYPALKEDLSVLLFLLDKSDMLVLFNQLKDLIKDIPSKKKNKHYLKTTLQYEYAFIYLYYSYIISILTLTEKILVKPELIQREKNKPV